MMSRRILDSFRYNSVEYLSRQEFARERAITILRDHQRSYYGHCYCNEYVLGSSFSAHLVDKLLEAGIRIDIVDDFGKE